MLRDFDRHDDGPLLSVLQVSALLGLAPNTVREILDSGDIRGVRLGRNYRIVWRSVKAYLLKTRVLPLPDHERSIAETTMRASIWWVMRNGDRLLYIGSTDPNALRVAWATLRDAARRGDSMAPVLHWQQAQFEVDLKIADAFFNPVRT